MKPELKAMIDKFHEGHETGWDYFKPHSSVINGLREAWLATLRWRGDELWCGPVYAGSIWEYDEAAEPVFYGSLGAGRCSNPSPTREEARAAFEAAARKQIEAFFKEQAE